MEPEINDTAPVTAEAAEIILKEKKSSLFTSPWLSLILLILLAVLYILFFFFVIKQPQKQVIPEALLYQKKGGLSIAFVNSDTIKAQYQLVKDLQENLETKFTNLNKDISNRQSALESRAADLQKKYEARQISLEEAQKMDEMLKMEGQKLYDLNQDYSDKIAQEELTMNKVYVDSINNFLERFNNQYNFDYILGYSKGGGILYARDTLDITKYVLEGLNQEYFKQYPESKKKGK
ncbi:MAG: OmpH family outer membrane protein [Bacteroidales bacterium]